MDVDAIVLGTGLSESIAAAALSKTGYKVAHIDTNQYYGGDEASLTLEELAEWADLRAREPETVGEASSDYLTNQRSRYTSISISRSNDDVPQSRQFAVSLEPSIVPSIGPHIDSLIASGVSRYGSFRLLEKVAIYDRPGLVQSVPGSKEDVFKSKVLSLLDKRRLMRFLMFAAGDFEGKKELEGREQMSFLQFLQEVFSLKDKAATAIAYALAFCTSVEESTLPAMDRIRRYLRSAGRYGASPFLVGHYGGLGETAQGFCRTSAVKGGLYVLGRRVLSVQARSRTTHTDGPTPVVVPSRYTLELEDFPEQLTGKVLLASPDYLPASLIAPSPSDPSSQTTSSVARCIAIVDRPLVFTPSEAPEEFAPADLDVDEGAEEGETPVRATQPDHEVDTAVLVFPPGCLANGSSTAAVHILVTGAGSMSTPKGNWIVHISMPLPSPSTNPPPPEELLRPYLDAALTLAVPPSPSPIFTLFYVHHPAPAPCPHPSSPHAFDIIITPPRPPLLPAIADAATDHAEAMFWRAVAQLKAAGVRPAPPTGPLNDIHTSGTGEDDTEDSELGELDSFWPPLDAMEDPETADDW